MFYATREISSADGKHYQFYIPVPPEHRQRSRSRTMNIDLRID